MIMLKLYCGKNTGPVVVNISDDLLKDNILCFDRTKMLSAKDGQNICFDENGKWIPIPGECACIPPKPMTRGQWRAAFA
jgi:hypothetical protein